MRSLPPKDYEAMPRLEAPAGYICVLRDIDRDAFRIDQTDHPANFIRAIVDEAERDFGIELVSILETENLRASAALLYERHQARLSETWHSLDAYQLAELRRSILQIDAHRSYYLTPKPRHEQSRWRTHEPEPAIPRAEARYGMLMTSNMGAAGEPLWRERQSAHQKPRRSAGAEGDRSLSQSAGAGANIDDLGQYLRNRLESLFIKHPFKAIFAIALLLVIGLILGLTYGYHATHNLSWPWTR